MNSLTSIPVEPNDVFPDVPGMIDACFSVAEFDLKGRLVRANANFLSLTGYDEDEVLGQHHSMFLSDDVVDAPEYGLCWVDLKGGKTKRVVLPWVTKSGQRKWVEENVGPVKDCNGNVVRIIRLGTDVTERHESLADLQGKVDAIEHSQAVIEFDTEGNILTANYNFLVAMGYSLSEVVGKHHSMFVDPEYAASAEYRTFWRSLAKGSNRACHLKRFGKDGREVWFEASYSPVCGPDGNVCKIVKVANDITDQVTSLTGFKTAIEAGCDEADQSVGKIDQSHDDISQAWRKAYAHLEVSTMVGARLVGSVDETTQRLTELRSVADQAFDHAIESDCAIAALEEAVDALRDCACEDPAMIEQINILEKRIGENARISSTVRTDINLMRSRVAVVSLAVTEQGEITNQISGELCSVQTALESSEGAFQDMVKAAEDVSAILGQTREASGILAR